MLFTLFDTEIILHIIIFNLNLSRYLMFQYPLTSAVFGSSLNMILLSVLVLLSWYRFFFNQDEEVAASEKAGIVRSL